MDEQIEIGVEWVEVTNWATHEVGYSSLNLDQHNTF